jgi:hypothetical protein
MIASTELADRWILGLRDRMVSGVAVRSGRWSIQLSGGVVVVTDAAVRFKDVTHTELPHTQASSSADPVLLVGQRVASAVGYKSGVLRIVFRPGYQFVAVPRDESLTRVRHLGVFEWVGSVGGGKLELPDDSSSGR